MITKLLQIWLVKLQNSKKHSLRWWDRKYS